MGWLADLVSLPYNAVTGSRTQMQIDADTQTSQAEIQDSINNACTFYGKESSACIDATIVGKDQQDALPADVASLNTNNCTGANLPIFGCVDSWGKLLSGLNTGVTLALVLVGILIIGYVWVVFGPVINRLIKTGDA